MFDDLPSPAAMRDLDDAALIDALSRWATASAAADARKYAAIAELHRRRDTREHERWACDDWDSAAAEVAAALNMGHGRASSEMDLAVTMRDRLPRVAMLFLSGEITGRQMRLVASRTRLVVEPEPLAQLDREIADRIVSWGPLSENKLSKAVDLWVDAIDPGALRRTKLSTQSRDFVVGEADDAGTTPVWGRLLNVDAALVRQRVAALARGVCDDDPRTVAQRSADALGALAAGGDHLACQCGRPDCPASAEDGRASSVVVHVVAEETSLDAEVDPEFDGEDIAEDGPHQPPDRARHDKPALILGGGPLQPGLLASLLARGAVVRRIKPPAEWAESKYRPSTALDEFVRVRDMTCRAPGCNRPAVRGDVDHTVAYPGGATHAGNLKCYCRLHHLLKTFWNGWSDSQDADGTVLVTTPTGHRYRTRPDSALYFPGWNVVTPAPPGTAAPPGPNRDVMMPTRKRTRTQSRADRIRAERALNDAHVAERNKPPPF
ncbi:HNH endonuclease signature motif containing protein [Mycolicibacterium grossiae]|uniref:DUF222 domain-containing protein n=1 Tax=Mycolicibacterium grossiae TaxID=1552759 RepID=A0A1E8PWQ8_9MYCO|nr:HNH endonuclease signature motif containing protein [Mycolicibacterium grossiae]OFJ50290.1 hypothetical protein BEL07_29170 [Mycolicibacterium grossiae]